MTEKQIFKRMSQAYADVYGDYSEDEWYGDDSPTIWRFHRPSTNLDAKLVMNEKAKRIDLFEKQNDEYRKTGNYSW